MLLRKLPPNQRQDFAAFGCQAVIFACAAPAVRVGLAPQPAQPRQAVQQRIKRAGAYFITMPAQLCQNRLSVNGCFARVLKNVHFP